jgi:hypothetical protein
MATYPLTWLADVLRAAGCTVIEEDGWKTRGRDGSFTPKAIMLHHDASPAGETSNGVDVIRDGRPGLAGPLSQLWLAYDGTWHVVAAGRANHAGEGGPWGVVSTDDGNGDAIGIETDHTTDEKWSDPQRSEALRGVHALAQRLGITSRDEIDRAVLAHKEYAPTRKVDPDPMNMDNARAQLAAYTGEVGLLGMSTVDVFSNPATQKFTGTGTFKTLTIDQDGTVSLLTGPKDAYIVSAGVTIEPSDDDDSIEAGDVVQVRLQSVLDYEGDKATVVDTAYPIVEVPITAGASFGNVHWANKIAGDSGGGRRRLRLFILPPQGKTLRVTHVSARALY